MTVDCQHCYKNIAEDENLIEYDEDPSQIMEGSS